MNEKKNKKLPLPIAELVSYIVGGLVGVWGIVYIILGLVARFSSYTHPISVSNRDFASKFGLGYMGWGLIILGIACLFIIIILCACAKKVDRTFEKDQRRAARLAQMKEARKNPEVIDASSEVISEEK